MEVMLGQLGCGDDGWNDERRPTARASAAGVLRPERMQAKRDNLAATPLAGHN